MSQDFDPIVADWVSFVSNPRYTLVEKCLKLAQTLEYPDLSINEYVQKLNSVGKILQASLSDVRNPTYLISMLNEHMFDILGFAGERDDYYNPKNNFLNAVLDKKSGIPITLSIIYAEVAKHIGLDLHITGFPSHVVVKYGEEMVLDPFDGGKLLSIDDLREIIYESYGEAVEFLPEFLDDIESKQILVRMIRNLKNAYVQSYAYDMAMRCIDMALSLEPDSPEEIRDKGILEERLLHYNDALEHLNRYLEINPNAEDVDFILELIKSIREKN